MSVGEELKGLQRCPDDGVINGIRLADHMGLIYSIAHRFRWAVTDNAGLDFDDLVTAGFIGMMRAAELHDPTIATWGTFATYWIRQAVGREIANRRTTVREPVHYQAKRRAEKRGLAKPALSLNAPILDDDGDTWIDWQTYEHTDMRDSMAEDHLATLLEVLEPRERRVLDLRFGHAEATLNEIGLEIGVTRERVRQIEVGALAKLRAADKRLTREKLRAGVEQATG